MKLRGIHNDKRLYEQNTESFKREHKLNDPKMENRRKITNKSLNN